MAIHSSILAWKIPWTRGAWQAIVHGVKKRWTWLTTHTHTHTHTLEGIKVIVSSVTQLCPTLCNPMDCSTLGLPSPTPGACLNSYPLSWWCHQTISSSVIPFSSCLQSFPASGSFPMNQFFASGGLDEIKVANQLTLKWNNLGLYGWAQYNHKDS